MTGKKARGNPRIVEALLELAQDFRGTLLSEQTADKVTMRILGGKAPAKPAPLEYQARQPIAMFEKHRDEND